ncbi:MAG: SsrA-binding protein SmpB [Alphaproteobacteria bacterium]|nr:SsrA-binding protein SmpB [Alphaproteobacteria bacterium]
MARKSSESGTVAQNRRARYDYFIDEKIEAGIVLQGTEVKSLRQGQASLSEAWAGPREGDLWLNNCYIPEYNNSAQFANHEARRPRKLLLHKREIQKLTGAANRQGVTIVPMSIYFNDRGIAKVMLGLARGKRQVDKRQTTKDRDWQRQKARVMRERD